MIVAHLRGWEVVWDKKKEGWFYVDNGKLFDDSRACKRCGEFPTKEGHDACLGTIPKVKNACCGHGITKSYKEALE